MFQKHFHTTEVLSRIHTMMISMKMLVFCVLSILGCFSVALDASSSFGNVNNKYFDYASNSRFAQNLPQKRYTYVSEYKRLPVYNFGIGKVAHCRTLLFYFCAY